MNFSELWNKIKIRKWAKYVITLVVFLIIYLFVSDQSILHFVKRGREIRSLEEQRDIYREQTEKAESELKTLMIKDSLERYAREQYFMHEKGEDIYLVEEP